MEISFCSHLNTNKVIATIFGTWHNSWAVVACAKFCCDMITSYWTRAKCNFHRIWIVMEKSLVKWVPRSSLLISFKVALLALGHLCDCPYASEATLGLYLMVGWTSYRNISKTRSPEMVFYNDRIALKFHGHLGSTVSEVPVKFQSDWKHFNQNLVALRLREINKRFQ